MNFSVLFTKHFFPLPPFLASTPTEKNLQSHNFKQNLMNLAADLLDKSFAKGP